MYLHPSVNVGTTPSQRNELRPSDLFKRRMAFGLMRSLESDNALSTERFNGEVIAAESNDALWAKWK